MTQSSLTSFLPEDDESEDADVLTDGGSVSPVSTLSRDVLYLRNDETGASVFILGENDWETAYAQTGGTADGVGWEELTADETTDLVAELLGNNFEIVDARGWGRFNE